MPRFAANLSMLYPELPLRDRVSAAAADGFGAVEVQFPYEVAAEELRRALRDARLPLVLMNVAQGDASAGERGLAALPGREADFKERVDQAIDYARTVESPLLHVMAGRPPPEAKPEECLHAFMRNLTYASAESRGHGVEVVIEPLNTRDVPGYYLTRQQQAADVICALRDSDIGLQMDFYHLQIMEGDLLHHLEKHLPLIAHVQIAGVPSRNEPDTGEVNFPFLFAALDRCGYSGWVGCEYRPALPGPGGTSAGLGWMRRL